MSAQAAQTNNAGKTDEASAFDQLVAQTAPQEKKPVQNEARADKRTDDKAPAQDGKDDKAEAKAETGTETQADTKMATAQAVTQDNKDDQGDKGESPADAPGDVAPVIDAQASDPALIAQPLTPQPVVQPVVAVVPVLVAAANDDAAPQDLPAPPAADAPSPPADLAQTAASQANAAPAPITSPQVAVSTDAKPAPREGADIKVPDAMTPVAEHPDTAPAAQKPEGKDAETKAAANSDGAAAAPKPDAVQTAAMDVAAAPKAAPPQAAPTSTNMAVQAAQPSQAAAAPAAMPEIAQHVQVSAEAPKPNMPALAVEIAAKSLSGAKQFDIRLDPPELGRVEVRLSIDAAGKASAHLSADQPQTLDLLQKDASVLTRALRDAGLDVSQNSLNFSLRHQNQDGNAHHGNARTVARAMALNASHSIEATPTSASWRGDGRLDIRV